MTTLPSTAGISLKPQHYLEILETQPDIGWLEVHPENYMCEGGVQHQYLDAICQHYPLSMHGVGASLGSAENLDSEHLARLKNLNDKYQPASFSEHLAWTQIGGRYSNDLLPVPYIEEALEIFCRNVQQLQDHLGRQVLIENPSVYLGFEQSQFSEGQFLSETVKQTGCGLLLDINNIVVSANNLGLSKETLLEDYPLQATQEIHLAGHTETKLSYGRTILLDNHGSKVSNEVWSLYKEALTQIGRQVPTLVEWDTDIPELTVLLEEANKAQIILDKSGGRKND